MPCSKRIKGRCTAASDSPPPANPKPEVLSPLLKFADLKWDTFCPDLVKEAKQYKHNRPKIVRAMVQELLKNGIVESAMFSKLSERVLPYLFDLYDRYVFNGILRHLFPDMDFGVSNKPGELGNALMQGAYAKISLNYELLLNAFASGRPEACNGTVCHTRIDALMGFMEHEILHCLILRLCPEKQDHGPMFKRMAYHLFGHTTYKHDLGRPLLREQFDAKTNIVHGREYWKVGEFVATRDGSLNHVKITKLYSGHAKLVEKDGTEHIISYLDLIRLARPRS